MSTTTSHAPLWTRVCRSGAPFRRGHGAGHGATDRALHVDGSFYAIDDTCTHETYSLAEGYIEGTQVECALHFREFDLRTGEALCLPAQSACGPIP